MRFLQRCVMVLVMCSNAALPTLAQTPIATTGGANGNAGANAQIGSTQGNAMVQPFLGGDQLAGEFINDVSNTNTEDRSDNQLSVSDFQNAGFSAADAQKIVANLNVGSDRGVVQPVATTSTTTAPVTATQPVASEATPAPIASEPTPATNDRSSTGSHTMTLSPSAAASVTATTTIAPTPAPTPTTSAPTPTTSAPTPTTSAASASTATAFSVNLDANPASSDSDDSSSKSSSGIGAATLLLGGGGCVLAVAAAAFVYRKKLVHPQTPGTPDEKKATYFHCEARLTPPVYIV